MPTQQIGQYLVQRTKLSHPTQIGLKLEFKIELKLKKQNKTTQYNSQLTKQSLMNATSQ